MKKNNRRWLALCLALALVFSLVVVASAASNTFTYDGGSYTATVTKGTSNDKKVVIPNATPFEHTYGNITPHMDNRDFNITHSASVFSPFASQIYNLLGEVGLQRSCTANDSTGNIYYYAEVYDATGTYKLGIRFKCYRAAWSVLLEMPSATGTTYPDSSDTIDNAPDGPWYIEPIKVS